MKSNFEPMLIRLGALLSDLDDARVQEKLPGLVEHATQTLEDTISLKQKLEELVGK